MAALTLLIVGCAAGPAPTVSGADRFEHVHGLDVDPARGIGYVATHAGVWQLPAFDSEPVTESELNGPIADRAMDAMGFVMDGPTMYTSGHPDPAEYPDLDPANLGLLTSFDRGQSWKSVALWGDTDFHDLSVFREPNATFRVYGYDAAAEAIRYSLDSGRTWNDGQTGKLRDLAADPLTPGRLFATSPDGLLVSTDDGASFTPAPNAPPLYLVDAADAGGTLVIGGVDGAGAVWVKTGDGPWIQTGSHSGEADAFSLSDAEQPVMLIADAEDISVSTDLGSVWRPLVVRSDA